MKARFFALAALVLGLASCQQEFNGAAPVGGEVDFQLSVDAVELATRAGDTEANPQNAWDSAFGAIDYLQALAEGQEDTLRVDWTDVDLRYTLEVYDAEGLDSEPVKDRQVVIVDSYQKATFDLRLVPGREYQFVVFADFVPQGADTNPAISAQRDLGLHHVIGNDLRDIQIKEDGINDECTDAYFASERMKIVNSATKEITLRRPFGKVRVIATDLAELNLNVDPAFVVVNYTAKHPQTFNAVTGTIGAYEENVSYEFLSKYAENVGKVSLDDHYYTEGWDAVTAKNNNGVKRHTHMTLFTDYILATEDQQTIQFTMAVYDKKNGLIKETNFNTEIPVQRNNLTTVIGNVLTTATEINVTIDDNFANEEIVKPVVFVNTAKELQEALDAYKNGQTILFDANIEGNVVINQKVDKHYVIDGNDYYYDGVIEINGDARQSGEDSVTLRNINFKTTKQSINVIDANDNTKYGNKYNYAHNVTVENCTFELGEGSVALKMRGSKNLNIVDCTMTAGHSFAQLYGCNYVTIEGIEVNAKSGISFGTSTNAVLKKSTIVAEGYGVRVDAEGANALTVEGSSVKAFVPVVARKASAKYTFKFEGDNVLEAPGYDVVFTTGDDEATFVAPAEYAVEGADNFKVFPRDNFNFVYTADDLNAAVAAGGDYLLMPTTIEGTFAVNKPVILKGVEGATIKGRVNVGSYGSDSQFKNIKFAINDASKHKNTFSGAQYKYPGIVVIYSAAASFDGCEFETNINAGVCGINYGAHAAGKKLVVNNCKFEGDFYAIRTRTLAEITNNEFDVYTDQGTLCAVWTWGNDASGANSLVFTNNTNVNEHGIYGVQVTSTTFKYDNVAFVVENNTGFVSEFATSSSCDYTNSTLNGAAIAVTTDALKNAANAGHDVYLLAGEYTMPAVSGKTFAISGSRNAVITVNKPNLSGSDVTFEGVTVKGSGYATGVQHVNTVTYNNAKIVGEMCLYGEKVEFNNCEFELGNGKYLWVYGCKNAAFNGCEFNTAGKAILVYNEGAGANNVTVKGCTFNATAGAKAGDIANQNCAAIEINNYQNSGVGVAHNVTAYDNTYDSNFSGEWRIKKFVAGNAITVNGVAYEQIAIDGKLMTIDADKNVTVL